MRAFASCVLLLVVGDGPGPAVGCRPYSPERRRRFDSDVEADVQHVAVADHVRLALEPLQALSRRLGVGAGGDEVVAADHLAADEPARDVGVDRPRRVERGLPVPQRPGARLLLARGEERDQVERVAEPADDLLERGRATVAERRGLLVGQLGQLRLEREVDAARAVLDRDQRLRRQRLELAAAARRRTPRAAPPRRCARAPCAAPRPPCGASRRPTSPASRPARAAARRGRGRRRAARGGGSRGRRPGRRPARTRRARRAARRPGAGFRAAPARCPGRPGRGSSPASPSWPARPRRARRAARRRSSRSRRVVFPYSPPAAFVSAVKSVVFPAPGRPTIPTSSAMSSSLEGCVVAGSRGSAGARCPTRRRRSSRQPQSVCAPMSFSRGARRIRPQGKRRRTSVRARR